VWAESIRTISLEGQSASRELVAYIPYIILHPSPLPLRVV